MTIYIDIDDTICFSSSLNYDSATPNKKAIDKANELYDNGHTIIYWTARGTVTGIDWSELTKKQFADWGVKYHNIEFGKPAYDLFIDDKNMNSEKWWEKIDKLLK